MITKSENVKIPFDSQIEALNHIYDAFNRNINPICALGPGLGKTVVACEIIWHIINKNEENYRILIINKASNFKIWENELKSYFLESESKKPINSPSEYTYLHGSDRKRYINKGKYFFPNKMIFLSSYETLSIDIENILFDPNVSFDIIIFDELHTIINSKKLTNKNKNIYQISASRKLALTASPIQNEIEEIGIQYAFLNDPYGFANLVNLYSGKLDDFDNNCQKSNKDRIKNILTTYIELCEKYYAVFHFDEEKGGFERNVITLSLPIDDNMLSVLYDMSFESIPKKRMFLSAPKAVYKDEDKNLLPHCTKIDAIKIILQSMLHNEKAIIFSLYIDVLIAYFSYLKSFGFSSMMITGDDKCKKQEEKLKEFEDSKDCRVLLTTLQKLSEGFNFPFATHVIILEFWWNPQKIKQAMGRIDRKTQTRNIFIYILCYNINGTMIELDRIFYDRMIEKLVKTNNFFKNIEEMHPKKNSSQQTKYKSIPEPKFLKNIETFEDELKLIINQFQHTIKRDTPGYDKAGFFLADVKNHLWEQGKNYLNFLSMIENSPWQLCTEINKSYLDWYCNQKVTQRNNFVIDQLLNYIPMNDYIPPKLGNNYQFIFYSKITLNYRLNSNGIIDKINIVLLIGKKIMEHITYLEFIVTLEKIVPLSLKICKKEALNLLRQL